MSSQVEQSLEFASASLASVQDYRRERIAREPNTFEQPLVHTRTVKP